MSKLLSFLGVIIFVCTVGCSGGAKKNNKAEQTLFFSILQDRDIYEESDHGESPQFAIWLENKETGDIRTVFVTHRTGTGNFVGKVECPVSLPAWIGAFRKETGREDLPTPHNPMSDAVTGATPKTDKIELKFNVPTGSKWYYFIEVNVSTDYNATFASVLPDGMIDSQGNGQPSIIYRGEISGTPGDSSTPTLIGRTEQMYFSPEINHNLDGIGNAKEVFKEMKITCIE